jgi:hypothetical protein
VRVKQKQMIFYNFLIIICVDVASSRGLGGGDLGRGGVGHGSARRAAVVPMEPPPDRSIPAQHQDGARERCYRR